jgi:hypothetical protein
LFRVLWGWILQVRVALKELCFEIAFGSLTRNTWAVIANQNSKCLGAFLTQKDILFEFRSASVGTQFNFLTCHGSDTACQWLAT